MKQKKHHHLSSYIINKLKLFITSISYLFIITKSQVVLFNTDTSFYTFSHQLINPTNYQSKTYSNTYTTNCAASFNTGGGTQSKILFGITGLNFKQSAASLSFQINNIQKNTNSFQFDLNILNQTVLYRLKINSVIFDNNDINQILYYSVNVNCQQLNQGTGYRSQNFTFPISLKPQFDPQVGQIYASLYYKGFNMFNPKGNFFYINWQFYYNVTHYTILLNTMDQNIISFVNLNILIVDLNYAAFDKNYKRMFYLATPYCSNQTNSGCPGKSGWNTPVQYNLSQSYLFGLSSFQISKHTASNWYFDQTLLTNLAQNYIQTSSFTWANISLFIVALRDCVEGGGWYFDPETMTSCVASCTTLVTYTMDSISNPKVCKKCHYSCLTCINQNSNQCTSCDSTKHRIDDGTPSPYQCKCQTGYLDMGLTECQSCEKYILGCSQCSSQSVCTLCGSGRQVNTNNKCECISPTNYLSRIGKCGPIYGCQRYAVVNSISICISCNSSLFYYLNNYNCSCIAGYTTKYQANGAPYCEPDSAVCGDGIKAVTQPCDDHNNDNGDGCNQTCQIQPGYLCFADLRETSFCLQSRTTLQYVGAMKIQGQTTVDLYFSLRPYNEYLDNVGYLSKFLITSISDQLSFVNLAFYTKSNFDQNQLRIRLRINYIENVNGSILHYMNFTVSDSQSQFQISTKFNIIGINIQLTTQQGYANMVALNYIILVMIILAFIALIISLFSQNWIGIQLIHTFQFCFFYFVLLQDIDQKQVKYLSFLELCNGFNDMTDFLSIYEYLDFNKKIYLLNFRRQIFLNFNFTSIVFSIPIILLIIKALRPIVEKCFSDKKQGKQQSSHRNYGVQQTKLDYFLSSQFIIGKLFVTFNLVFMNQILFCFFIEQTSYLLEHTVFNGLFQQIFLFFLVSCVMLTIGLLIVAALRPFKFNTSDIQQQVEQVVQFIKFKRFNALYPMIYSIFVGTKIIFLALFFTSSYSVYFMWGIQIAYMIGYMILRPYKKTRDIQQDYCYLLHNLHNIWNSCGLSILIGVMLMQNLRVNSDSYIMDVSIRITILVVEMGSLILGYLRLFASKRLTRLNNCCNKQNDMSNDIRQDQFDDTDRRLRNDSLQKKQMIKDKKDYKVSNRNK